MLISALHHGLPTDQHPNLGLDDPLTCYPRPYPGLIALTSCYRHQRSNPAPDLFFVQRFPC
jgi:hypothetical protein